MRLKTTADTGICALCGTFAGWLRRGLQKAVDHMGRLQRHLQTVFILAISALTMLMMLSIGRIQGNAKVINYAGIVRGGTQRLVKEELHGMRNDALITERNHTINDQSETGRENGYVKICNYTETEWGV